MSNDNSKKDVSMLSDEGKRNIELIKKVIFAIWGNDVKIVSTNVMNYPFDAFEMYLLIYKKYSVMIEYDRSIVDILLKKDKEYVLVAKLTNTEFIRSFESSKEYALIRNFYILDDILKKMEK